VNGNTEALTSAATDPLPATEAYTKTLGNVNRVEVIDYAIKFQRLRHRIPTAWLAHGGLLLLGAGIGAWVQDDKVSMGYSALVVGIGAALLVGATMIGKERAENLDNLCDDFLRFVDRWPPMEQHYECNSDYVKDVAAAHTLRGKVRKRRDSRKRVAAT
jgi:hypothetical protein